MTLAVLVLLFGAYALVDGIFALTYAFSARTNVRAFTVVQGLAGIAAGIATLVWPGLTAFVFLYLIAAWAVITGVLEIAAAIDLRKVIQNEWLLALGGVGSVGFGVILAVQPEAGAVALIWVIGTYAVIYGAVMIALAFRLRSLGMNLEKMGAPGFDRPRAQHAA
jgi:uncharacterized membrane protein HdeD (DUF308 family)